MAKTPKPDKRNVKIGRHNVVTYSYGEGDEVLFLLNGGPGIPCNYLRDPLLPLVEAGYLAPQRRMATNAGECVVNDVTDLARAELM